MLPQETLRSLAKVVSSPENLCICLQNLRSLAKVLLHSPAKSIAFPKKLCIGLQMFMFSHKKIMKHISFPHLIFSKPLEANAKVLHCLKKHLIYSPKYYIPTRNIASLAKLLRLHTKVLQSPEKLCNACRTFAFSRKNSVPPIKFAFAHKSFALICKKCCVSQETLHSLAKFFHYLAKLLRSLAKY